MCVGVGVCGGDNHVHLPLHNYGCISIFRRLIWFTAKLNSADSNTVAIVVEALIHAWSVYKNICL